ncbi:IS630 family transposase [Vibrio sp. TRT 17S01]|uniref:IS630 family transposase n=1 Tax=Vibrio sp. TRT 17S01 TaxID=3418505 RepID=UPI003CF12805
MKITLTPQQKLPLEQMHGIERDSRVCDRIKAVLLASEGWSQTMISQALRIHESTVARHLIDYVLSEKHGGSQSKLSTIQTTHLIEHLIEKTYSHTHQIVTYVEETFGLNYTVSGMNKWLHHNGFSYKQPKGIPHKFDEAKQQAFIDAYEALKASCGKNESIVFIDAVHPTLSTKISHGWIRTCNGQDKAIETTGNRSRLNIIGALNLSDIGIGATIVHDYESINSETIVRFFCKLRESYPLAHKLHIILDGAGYHRSNLVRDAAFVLNIELHYLPPYSPNLNPIEPLWKVMNEKSRNNVYFSRKRDFKAAIAQFFAVTLPESAGSLTSRINDNFQVLKPASSS